MGCLWVKYGLIWFSCSVILGSKAEVREERSQPGSDNPVPGIFQTDTAVAAVVG